MAVLVESNTSIVKPDAVPATKDSVKVMLSEAASTPREKVGYTWALFVWPEKA